MSLNDFYHVVSKKIEDIYNSSNHSFQKWIKHSHPSRHQKVSYSLEKLTITTSQEVCAAVLDGEIPLLCTIYFVQLETKEHFFHIFLSRSKRIPLNRMFFFLSFFLWSFCLENYRRENTAKKSITTFCMINEHYWFSCRVFHNDHLNINGVD